MKEADLTINPRDTEFAPLDFPALFHNANPVTLEIGSGKGRFLISSATVHRHRNFVGIEKSLHYHRVIHDRVRKRRLQNIMLVNHDAFLVMRDMLSDAVISELHVYFPDPWPRKREKKRRIIRPEALVEMRRVLVDSGSGIYVTDHREYFEAAAPVIADYFASEPRVPGPDEPPRTNYEAKYRAEGREIFEVRFWKAASSE